MKTTLVKTLLFLLLISTTLTAQTDLLFEDFNSTPTTGVLPQGWDTCRWVHGFSAAPTANYLWKSDAGGYNSSRCAYLFANQSYTLQHGLMTPARQFDATKAMKLSFDLKNYTTNSQAYAYLGGELDVLVTYDNGATIADTIALGINTGTRWQHYEFPLTRQVGATNVRILFLGMSDHHYYLDNVRISDLPQCKPAADIYVSSLSTTGASFYWNLGAGLTGTEANPSGFIVRIYNADNDSLVSTATAGVDMTYTATGLTPATRYRLSVTSNCGSTLGTADAAEFEFQTFATPAQLPYYIDFESGIPAGSFGSNYQHNVNAANAKGSGSLQLTTTQSANASYIAPLVAGFSDSLEIDLLIKPSSPNVTVKFGVLTNPYDDATLNELATVTTGTAGVWQSVRFNTAAAFDHINPSMLYIAIDNGADFILYVDSVHIHHIPSCIRPENITCTGRTHNSVSLAWQTSSATSYRIAAYHNSTVAFQQDVAATNSYTVAGLAPNTSYLFSVKALCSATDESEVKLLSDSVRTLCDVADTVVMFDGAESAEVNRLPDCWTTGILTVGTGSGSNIYTEYPFCVTTTRHSGSQGFQLRNMKSGTISYLSSQKRDFGSQQGRYTLRIWVNRTASTIAGEGIDIWITPNEGDTAGGDHLGMVNRYFAASPAEASAGWYRYDYIINHTGMGFITIIGKSNNGYVTSFDDIEIMATPSCPYVRNLAAAAPASSSISLSWTPGGSESQWLVGYSATSAVAPSLSDTLLVSTPSYTISGLESAVPYSLNAFVQAVCAPQDSSEAVWVNNHSFTTACSLIDTLPYRMGFEEDEIYADSSTYYYPVCWSRYNDYRGTQPKFRHVPYINKFISAYGRTGTYAIYGQVSDETAYNSIMLLPQIDTSAFLARDLRLKFWARQSNAMFSQNLYVGVMTDPSDLNTWVTVDTIFVATTDWTEHCVPLDSYLGNGSFIGFNFTKAGLVGGSVSYTYIDDLLLERIPDCIDITEGITILNVSDTSATVSLGDSLVTSWQYAVGVKGATLSSLVPVSVAGAKAIVYGLSAETEYDIYVRSDCGSQHYGYWTDAVSFRTSRTPAPMPYSCGFEDAAENANWLFSSLHPEYYNFTVGTNANALYSGSKSVYVTNGGSSGAYTYTATAPNGAGRAFASRAMSFDSKGYQVNLKWKSTGGQSTSDFGRIFLTNTITPLDHTYQPSTQEFNIAVEALLDNGTPLNISNYTKHSPDANGWCSLSYFLDMTGRAGTYNLVLMWNQDMSSGRTSYPLAVDDISITELSCIPPTFVDVAPAAASVTFTVHQPEASAWEVIVDSVPLDPSAAPLFRQTSADSVITISGLNPNARYYYSFRSVCSASDTSSWRASESFQSLCAALAVPYSEDFERAASINCWSHLSSFSDSSIALASTRCHSAATSLLATNTIVVSPEFDVDSLHHYQLSGFVYSTADSVSLRFSASLDQVETSSLSDVIATEFIPAKGVWREFTIFFDSLSSPDFSDFRYSRFVAIDCEGATLYFDDLTLKPLSACAKPNHIYITNVGEYQFDITFDDRSGASRWLVETTDAYSVVRYDTITSTTATVAVPYAHSEYDVRVAAICSDSSLSDFAVAGSLTTACAAYDLPYTTGFETSEGWATPTSYVEGQAEAVCWATLNIRPAGAQYPEYRTISTRRTGAKALYAYSTSPVSKEGYLILPAFNAPTSKLKVEFYGRVGSSNNFKHIEFGYITDVTNDSSYVNLLTCTDATTFTHYECDLTTFSGIPANARLAFRISKRTGGIYIDDLSVTRVLTCTTPAPASVIALSDSSATLVVSDTAHTSFQYVCVPRGILPSSVAPLALSAGDTLVVAGLADNTAYDFYLRAVCDSLDQSDWARSQFTTACLPFVVSEATPFFDGFEGYAYGTLLNGSSCYGFEGEGSASSYKFKIYPASTPSASSSSISYYAHDESHLARCAALYASNAAVPYGAHIVRRFSLEAGKLYAASAFFRAGSSLSSATRFSFVLQSDTIASLTVNGKSAPAATRDSLNRSVIPYNTQYEQLKTFFSVPSTGIYSLAIHVANASSSDALFYGFIDDWSLSEFYACTPSPFSLDSVAGSSAFFSVADSVASHSWEYVLNDTLYGTPVQVTSPRFRIDSLMPSSSYTLYLRTVCSPDNHSEWVRLDFTSACGSISAFPYQQSLVEHYLPPCWRLSGDTLTTAPFDFSSAPYGYDVSFRFYRYNNASSSDLSSDMLRVSLSGVEYLAVPKFINYAPAEPSAGYYTYGFTIPSSPLLTSARILFVHTPSASTSPLLLDDFTVTESSGCYPPSSLHTVGKVTGSHASFAWSGSPAALGYGYQLLRNGSLLDSGSVATTSLSLDSLTPLSSYILRLRTLCADGPTAWVSLAFDNLSADSCPPLHSISLAGISCSSASFVLTRGTEMALSPLQYGLSLTTSPDDILSLSLTTSDTLFLDNLIPGTRYHLFARTLCDSLHLSRWLSLSFRTPAVPQQLPYICDFESAASSAGWSFASGRYSWFVSGNAVGCGSSRSLYVTDLGSRYYYSSPGTPSSAVGVSYAYIPLAFGGATYEVDFDWMADGVPGTDYGRALLAPVDADLTADLLYAGLSSSTVPQGWIALDGSELSGVTSWHHRYATVSFADSVTMNLLFLWRQNHTGDVQPPLAVDNLSIVRQTCPPLASLACSVDVDSARIIASHSAAGTQVFWHLSSDSLFSDTLATGVTDSVISLHALSRNTLYHLRAALLCGAADTSRFTSCSFRTLCGSLSDYPYFEGFESMTPNLIDTVWYRDNCWSRTSTSSIAYSYPMDLAGYVHSGNQALYIYNGITSATQILAMPLMDSLDGKTISFCHLASSVSPAANTLSFGYLLNGTFVSLADFTDKSLVWSRYTALLSAIPASARLAFRFVGPYTYSLDDIRISRIVQGNTYNDSICFNQPYSRHGFSFPMGSLFPGDTSFTKTVQSVTPGVADSIITVNIHVYGQIATVAYDTICANTPLYIWGSDTIVNPTTSIHTQVFTAACGCDSTVALNLYVVPGTATISSTICQGDSLVIGDATLYHPGTYTVNTISSEGCNVVTTVNLTVIDSLSVTTAAICQGESYLFDGVPFTQTGVYRHHVTGSAGCDVIRELRLTVYPNDSTIDTTFCRGGSITIAGVVIRRDTAFSVSIANAGVACSTTYHVTASTIAPVPGDVFDNACEGYLYSGYGLVNLYVDHDTVCYVSTRTSDGLCDSITAIHIKYNLTAYGSETAVMPESGVYIWHDRTLQSPGTYTDTMYNASAANCDSIVTLTLTDGGLDVENIHMFDVSVVPNPVNAGQTSFVYVDAEVSEVEILSSFGQVVDSFVPVGYPIEVTGVSTSGIYYIRLILANGNVAVEKLIVK